MQELLTNGRHQLVRHTIYDAEGQLVHAPHFRPYFKD